MTMIEPVRLTHDHRPTSRNRASRWLTARTLRFTLLIAALAMLALGPLIGTKQSNYGELLGDLASGQTHTVTTYGALPQGATGFTTVRLEWTADGERHVAEVRQATAGPDANGTDESLPMVNDLSRQLHTQQSDVTIVNRSDDDQPHVRSHVFGYELPGWVVIMVATAFFLGVFGLLINGPQPLWATRWGWFWPMVLTGSAGAFFALAYLLLSGSAPGTPESRTRGKRLSGLASFVTFAILGQYLRSR